MKFCWLAISFCMFNVWLTATAYIIKWKKGPLPSTGYIKFKPDLVVASDRAENSSAFRKHAQKFANMSLDEKCEKGLDLSAAFLVYTPYVDFNDDGSGQYLVISGIVPAIMTDILRYCCPSSKVTYGELYKSIPQAEARYEAGQHLDFTFPLYGLDGKATQLYKENPFITLVEPPRMVLLVPERLFESKNTRTQVLLKTVLNSWPMLVFISVSASLSGLIIWFLDRNKNPGEFPPSFFVGAWEGFWWAFVTMTTVGYGDRSPKSIMARIFCIVWILCGIILISLFTGLVTAALSISATPVYNLPGAKIGAVNGSKEYQVGVGLNAEMKAYQNHGRLFRALKYEKLDGALIDNFILSAIRNTLKSTRMRIEREIPYSITYGVAIRSGSPKIEKCFRKYTHHYPQKIFETISDKLKPVKNPTDDVRVEVLAAEKLFYEENMFKLVVYVETGCFALFVVGGIIWEFFVRNSPTGKYGMFHATARAKKEEEEDKCKFLENATVNKLDSLIEEYDSFHEGWIAKIQSVREELHKSKNGHANSLKSFEVAEDPV